MTLDISKKMAILKLNCVYCTEEESMLQHHDEAMSWWESRPHHDRRGNFRPVIRKDGKVAHLYRYYLHGKIQPAINFPPNWKLDEIKAVVKKIEAKIHADEVAIKMGLKTEDGGKKIKSPTLIELIVWHLRECLTKNKIRTVKNYEAAFTDFMDFIGDTNALVSSLEIKQMYEYRTHLRERNSELTTTNRIKLIRAVFAHAKRKQQIEYNPFADYRGEPVPPSDERDILTAVEMREIGDMIKQEKLSHWQKIWLAWQIARYTGMRGSDILRLRFENINFAEKILSFKMPKRRDLTIVLPIHSSLIKILERLQGKAGPIFSFEDLRFKDQILIKRFGYYIKKFKGEKFRQPGSHTPRHSFNQIMLDNDIPYEYRCFLLGQAIGGEQAKYIHKRQKSHMDKLRSIIESLPLD